VSEYLLEMRGITKRFGGITALDDVNLKVETGEIHALVGENGAGKSTLMNVLSGLFPYGEYEGDIYYAGEECKFTGIRDSEHKGIAIIHQELGMVPLLSIAENIFLGNEQTNKFGIDWDLTHHKAKTLLDTVGLEEDPETPIGKLSVGKQQLVEIAKALSKNVRLLILDEPTASLNDRDSNKLLDLLRTFRDQGMTCIMISHKLSEIEGIADHITVLRDGHTIETLSKEDDTSEQRIIKSMVGREITDRFPKRTPHIGDVSLEIKNWTVWHPDYDKKVVDDANITLRKGEVVGISGLMGAGRSELAMSVFGKLYGRDITGELYLNGEKIDLPNVTAAVKSKIAYVTEDRKVNGLILSNPIRSNISLADLARVSEHGMIDADKEKSLAQEYRELLNVKSQDVEENVNALSGGNQQKVLLAKWMFTEPDVLILDEPTRGIDVGAKYEIYQFINKLVEQGRSVLMISSEMPELLGMCDRLYVMNEGRIVAELLGSEATQEVIMGKILNAKEQANG